jgi:Transposase DDE domain group 1
MKKNERRGKSKRGQRITPKPRFSEKRLTSRAGLVPMSRFIAKLGLGAIIDRRLTLARGANVDYSLGMIFEAITLGVISGCRHLSDVVRLGMDDVFMKTQGWEGFPVVSTITRVLERFTFRNCVELGEVQTEIRRKPWDKTWYGRVNLDFDSSAKSAYGHQEGVSRGHNTERSHKPMVNPVFAFIAQTGECLNAWLRPGNTASANGSVAFLKECLAMLPKQVWRVVVRADSAFFSAAFVAMLELLHCGYVIKVKIRNWKRLCAAQVWQKARGEEGLWTAEFEHQIEGWDRPRRFVAVRRLVGMLTPEKDGVLFPVPEYSYGLWVSNLGLTPLKTEEFYNKRAVAENLIGAGKNQMAFGSMLVHEFWASHALLQIAVLAYNVMIWFQRMALDAHRWRERPNTLRGWLIYLAARLLFTDGKWVLALSRGYPHMEEWNRMERRLTELSFS